MSRILGVALAVLATLAALATVAYLIGFLADLPLLPKTVDRPSGMGPAGAAAVDMGLVALFGVQHSLMARVGFQRWIRPELRRALYLLASCMALSVLMAGWQPLPALLWHVEAPTPRALLWGLFGFGWLLGATCLLLMNPAELFGFAQLARPREPVPARLRSPLFYKRIRHPLYLGFLFCFWSTPQMSVGHALFAAGMSAYILVGIVYEERDLVRRFGDTYLEYRRRTGKLLPRLGKGA